MIKISRMSRLQNMVNVSHTTPFTLRMSLESHLVIYFSNTDRGGNKFQCLAIIAKEIVYRHDTLVPWKPK